MNPIHNSYNIFLPKLVDTLRFTKPKALKISATSFLVTIAFFGVNTTTAAANMLDPLEQHYAEMALLPEVEKQTLTVVDAEPIVVPARDSYTIISKAEVDAEIARKAAEVAAAEAAARRKAAPASNRVAGITPGQVIPAGGVIAAAQQWVGVVPYGGGNHPSDSFSCDGYVQYVFAQNGISLPRGADSQARRGTVISKADARPGDLVWHPGQHIGIYAGGNMMYDSPKPGMYVQHRAIWGNPSFVRL